MDTRAKIISLLMLVPTVLTARSAAELAVHAAVFVLCAAAYRPAARVSYRHAAQVSRPLRGFSAERLYAGLQALSAGFLTATLRDLRFFCRSLLPVMMLAVFTLVLGVVSSAAAGANLAEAAARSAFVSLRLFVGVSLAVLLPLTSEPSSISDGISLMMRPLFGRNPAKPHHSVGKPRSDSAISVDELSAVAGLAIGFIPMLISEARRIMRAQMSRGAMLDCGGPFDRGRAFVAVLAPLVMNSLRRADDSAMALESRGFACGAERTRLRPLVWGRKDSAAVFLSALFAAVCVAARG